MTLGGMLAASIGLASLVLLPVLVGYLGISAYAAADRPHRQLRGAGDLRAAGAIAALSLRAVAAARRRGAGSRRVRLSQPLLWLAASALFSFYVRHLASYDATYGPLGAVVGVMMWFYVSALVVLVGAELNAELELQTRAGQHGGRGGLSARVVPMSPTMWRGS